MRCRVTPQPRGTAWKEVRRPGEQRPPRKTGEAQPDTLASAGGHRPAPHQSTRNGPKSNGLASGRKQSTKVQVTEGAGSKPSLWELGAGKGP